MTEDPRQRLAYDRTVLANERTFGAWIRTGLAIGAVGVAVAHLIESPRFDQTRVTLVGAGFVMVGIAVIAFGAWRFLEVNRALTRSASSTVVMRAGLAVALAAVLAVLLVVVLILL
jgi:putative membrane protein